MLVGVWNPIILLPENMSGPDVDVLELRHSLAHECGHIDRYDLVTWQIVNLCQLVLWIQPCYWILIRELRVAQDQLADQFAIQQTADRASYATTLLERSRSCQRTLPGALTMGGGKSNLYRRIEMLMSKKFRVASVPRRSILLSFAISLIVVGQLLLSLQLTHAVTPVDPATTRVTDENVAKSKTEKNRKTASKLLGMKALSLTLIRDNRSRE